MFALLGGLRLSFALLVLLGGLAALRAIIGQKTLAMETAPRLLRKIVALGFDSPDSLGIPLAAILLLFILNLGFSSVAMARRVRARQAAFVTMKDAGSIRSLANHAEFLASADAGRRLAAFLKESGLRVREEKAGGELRVSAGRRGAGLWGPFFFHQTLMIIIIGAALSMLTRYAGYAELSPGETFVEKHGNYLRVTDRPALFGGDRNFKLRLDRIDLTFWKPGAVKQRANVFSAFDGNGTFLGQRRTEINKPLHIAGTTVYQGTHQGFFAELEARDGTGTTIDGKARFFIPRQPGERMTDVVTVGDTGIRLELELFTEQVVRISGLESLGSTHMATLLKVTQQEGEKRRSLGVLFKGGTLTMDGITLRFVELKPYSSFVVSRDYGVPVIFAGCLVLLIGLLLTYFWVPETWWASVRSDGDGCTVAVGATAERYRETFRERFAETVKRLEEEVGAK
ncbi:cytochrome c biogenesis protein ResB [Geobacter sp.]|uniref:cytochrome c biogenesis protein ResB n=1 Tax=Geobacter sp. TaxID=46610 RepID=UPI002634F44A|nr:cytochrome c biogenesis protein ResB [Geobacter sp.]